MNHGSLSQGRCPGRVLASVWTTGQRPSRVQRNGRYLPESMRHPGKMLPAIAAEVIGAYTDPGELVLDPMCGIGTTLVEAIHLGRDAAGVEYESQWAELAAANVLHARRQGASGTASVVGGDARGIGSLLGELRGRAALVVTSPPYGSSTHGHVRSSRDSGERGVRKWNVRYSEGRGNLAYRKLDDLMDGFGQILSGCTQLLRPGGVVAITIRPIRAQGELIDLPSRVIDVAERAGLVHTDRLVALLCGLRDGTVVNRASFFQMLEARRAQEKGSAVCATAHEDLLIFQLPTSHDDREHAAGGSR